MKPVPCLSQQQETAVGLYVDHCASRWQVKTKLYILQEKKSRRFGYLTKVCLFNTLCNSQYKSVTIHGVSSQKRSYSLWQTSAFLRSVIHRFPDSSQNILTKEQPVIPSRNYVTQYTHQLTVHLKYKTWTFPFWIAVCNFQLWEMFYFSFYELKPLSCLWWEHCVMHWWMDEWMSRHQRRGNRITWMYEWVDAWDGWKTELIEEDR